METFKSVAGYIIMILFCIGWIASSATSAWKERNRHAEAIAMTQRSFETILAALQSLSRQKSLIVLRDDNGDLRVMALDTAGKEEVQRELAGQDAEIN